MRKKEKLVPLTIGVKKKPEIQVQELPELKRASSRKANACLHEGPGAGMLDGTDRTLLSLCWRMENSAVSGKCL